jgi:hypothetical protein
MVPRDVVVDLMSFLGIPEEASRVWKILCAVEELTRDNDRIAHYLESQGYVVSDISECMTAIRRIHTRGSCVSRRRLDASYRVILTSIHAVSSTNAHVDPCVLHEFKEVLRSVALEHGMIYAKAGYDMSPAGVVVTLLCACHDYLFLCKTHNLMNMFLFDAFVALAL